MSRAPYNGYTWQQREAILRAYKLGAAGDFTFDGKPCGLCGDPDRPDNEWHSEDYSQPFNFLPPASYPMCKACHSRVHKRFNQPSEEWELFCRHVDAGGFGREFTQMYPRRQRLALMASLSAGTEVQVQPVRERAVDSRWWRTLTLDPQSLGAAWARPRPWRARPDAKQYRDALNAVDVSAQERRLLTVHRSAPRRSASMRALTMGAFGKESGSAANLIYGRLAHRICSALQWKPDARADGSPIWMSVIAEDWLPSSREGERAGWEWVMVPTLASALDG